MSLLSIIIPAYNEERTLGSLLEKILALNFEKTPYRIEVIVVDDGSTDRTSKMATFFPKVRWLSQRNQGKGAAVQHGIKEATGDYVLVQDADLEYDPDDYLIMLQAIPEQGKVVVYGSRPLGQRMFNKKIVFPERHPQQSMGSWVANSLLTLWIALLYQTWITDSLTGYKLYPTSLIRQMQVKSTGFEADHEMTAKLIRRGIPIKEVPIRYTPRSVAEGKKIRATDGLIALWTLLKYRFGSV